MAERIEAWLRVRDGHRFIRDMRDAGRAVGSLGGAAHLAGNRMAFATRASYGARSAMYTLGTAARWGAAGFTLLAAGAIRMGIGFNSTMEQNQVAFSQFLGSGEKVDAMLEKLFQTAKETPFEFADVTTAARKFLAFGFTAQQTTRYLDSVGNAIAGIGGGNDEIQRMIIALGQMQAKGRVMGQELLQVTELGIPAYQILKEELNLTNAQVRQIGYEGIGAHKAIEALMKGMDKRFAGAAARQAQTLAGQWSTLKDIFRQTMGVITKPLFDILRKNVLPAFIRITEDVQKYAPTIMKGFWAGLTGGLAPGGKQGRIAREVGVIFRQIGDVLVKAFRIGADAVGQLFDALKPMMPFLENVVWPLVKGIAIGIGITLVGAFKLAIFVIRIIAEVLGFLGKLAAPLKPVFEGIGVAIGLLLGGPILKALSFVPKLGGVFALLGKGLIWIGEAFGKVIGIGGKFFGFLAKGIGWAVKFVAFYLKIYKFFIGLWIKGYIRAGSAVGSFVSKAVGFIAKMPGKVLSLGKKIVQFMWNGIKDLGSKIQGVIRTAMNDALGFLARMPSKFFNAGVKLAQAIWRGIKSLISAGAGFAIDLGKSLANAAIGFLNTAIPNSIPIPHAPDINLPDDPIPTFARGGRIGAGGWAWVGEEGPEPMWIPDGASIYPSSSSAARRAATRVGGPETLGRTRATPLVSPSRAVVAPSREVGGGKAAGGPNVIQLVVSRRVLAEVVAEEFESQRARR